jgi:hypothetical protein
MRVPLQKVRVTGIPHSSIFDDLPYPGQIVSDSDATTANLSVSGITPESVTFFKQRTLDEVFDK